MIRHLRIAALIAFLACTASSWGQVLQQDRYIMVKEEGKPAVKCKVLKSTKQKDGTIVNEVQPENGGPVMTLVEGGTGGIVSVKEHKGLRTPKSGSTISTTEDKPGFFGRIFSSSKSTNESRPTTIQSTSTGMRQTAPTPLPRPEVPTSKPVSQSTITPASKTTSSSAVQPVTHNTVVPTSKTTTSPQVQPTSPVDFRQSWGKVESNTTSTVVSQRPSLPVAKPMKQDPIERPDLYTNVSLPSETGPSLTPVNTNTLPAVPSATTSTAANLPVGPVTPVSDVGQAIPSTAKSESLPTPETTPVITQLKPPALASAAAPASTPAPTDTGTLKSTATCDCASNPQGVPCTTCTTKPSRFLRKSDFKNCPTCTDQKCKDCGKAACTTCTQSECKDCGKAACSTCATTGQPVRSGLLSVLGNGGTTVREPKPIVVKEPKPTVVRERVVHSGPVVSGLPKNEGRVGVFSGMKSTASSTIGEGRVRRNPNLPAGLSSVTAAQAAALAPDTPLGAMVRMPDGTVQMVPTSQVPPQMPSVSVAAANAFTVTQATSIPYVTLSPDQAANAFAMGTPTRPIPADMGSYPQIPNAFAPLSIPGAERVPQLAIAPRYYNPYAMGYYPAQMGYYPSQPMLHPGAMQAPGTAVVSDMNLSPHASLLATLRMSLLPSERERAVQALAQSNWKADPQVVPALVMAAKSDPAPTVRVSCLRALGQMKANTEPVIEALHTLREDGDPRIRHEANQLLPVLTRP